MSGNSNVPATPKRTDANSLKVGSAVATMAAAVEQGSTHMATTVSIPSGPHSSIGDKLGHVAVGFERSALTAEQAIGYAGPDIEGVVNAKVKYDQYMEKHPDANNNDQQRRALSKAYTGAQVKLYQTLGEHVHSPGDLDLAKGFADKLVDQQVTLTLSVAKDEKTLKQTQGVAAASSAKGQRAPSLLHTP